MSETLREGMHPQKAGMSAMLQSIGRLFGGSRARKGGEYADDAGKPVTVRVRGDGVAYVDPMELMRSKKVQTQLAEFGEFFQEEKLRERDSAVERWLHEEVTPVYDKFMEDPKCTRSAHSVFKDLRARHRKELEGGG